MMHDENAKPNKPVTSKAKGGKSIEETYVKKTQLEHILLRPDTYVGSVEKQQQQMWVYDKNSQQVEFKQITFVPGLYKIFDEIIVNAADNKQRDNTMSRIEVTINEEENFIRVYNNGNGVPIALHQEHNIYVPELIFGHLLTGSNFNDKEEKTTGGRNGYGAKLANIFSKKFIIETVDQSRGLKYRQEFTNNMGNKAAPEITKFSGSDFTCITFYPDLERFKMDCLDADIVSLLSKRVYDIAGTNALSSTGAKLNVYLNGAKIDAKNFEQYIGFYKGIEDPVAFEKVSDRWEIGVGQSDGSFQQVSFVNSISTTKGGCHVTYITDQITAKLMSIVKKRNKGEEVKASNIKNHLCVYVNCLIVNPAFDSQTKETLTTKAASFGSTCTVSDRIIKAIEKSPIIEAVLSWAKYKQTADLKKKGGSKSKKITGITKLDDANFAGSSKSSECTLILTEGDSAKALAISGLGVVGRDFYGVFPLKGKLLNVREAAHSQMMKNEEIQNIARILGLTFNKEYENTSSLRYGHLMIMADQDHDGSHIKGLLINFLHHFWPSLLKIKGFLQQFITPIVKCSRGLKKSETFFTIPEYQRWREENEEGKGWKIKYYKGLGTSTAAEAKEYFSNLSTHEVDFQWDERADDMIDMAFAKKRVDDRKLWLLSMEPGVHIDYTVDTVSYDDFINHELILFSHADNERSIPHYMDGLKPSQRKVLFTCFKRNLKQELKVVQLAGSVSEQSAYHHGEVSLTQTIIGMAQNFVGSNNINLLSPCGQFGTRLMGGKDAASARYVFTKLESITRHIFHPHDDPLLEYLDDDGQSIEPKYYVPIIPMALVNGSEGIGTGWSSSIPTYNPREIIANLRKMINLEEPEELQPWFRGFTGAVMAKSGKDCNNFTVSGTIERVDESTVVISELPVGKWTNDYKQFLESVMIGAVPAPKEKEDGNGPAVVVPFVKDFKENHTDTTVLFTVTCAPEKLNEFEAEKGGLAKRFKLEGSVATSNMHMFNLSSQIHKYEGPMEVMQEFYNIRLMFYDKRKKHLSQKLSEEWEKLDNKMKFILAVCQGKLVVSNRKKADIMVDLRDQGFKAFYEAKAPKAAGEPGTPEEEGAEDEKSPANSLERGYDYLLSMKIWSLTLERVKELQAQRDAKRIEVDVLLATPAESLWLSDLDHLEEALESFEAAIDEEKRLEIAARKKAGRDKANKGKSGSKKGARSKKGGSDDESEEEYDSEYEAEKKRAAAKKKAAAAAAKPAASTALATKVVAKPAATVTDFFKPTTAPAAGKAPAVSSSSSAVPPAITIPAKTKPKITMSAQPIEIDRETMSLADRLKAAAAANKEKAEVLGTVNKNLFDAKPSKPAAAAVPKPKAAPKKSKAVSSESEDDLFGEGGPLSESAPAVSRPARTTAVVKKTYVLDSDLDDDDEEEADNFSEEEDESCSEEEEDFDEKPKKKAAAPKKEVAKPAAKPIAKPVALKTTPVKKAPTGVKCAAKGANQASAMDLYSPAAVEKVAKKPRATKPAADKPAKAAKPAAASKKAAAAPKKKNVVESEEEFDEDDASFAPVSRSPKQGRARKPVNFKAMYADSEEEDDFIVEDDESEFDE